MLTSALNLDGFVLTINTILVAVCHKTDNLKTTRTKVKSSTLEVPRTPLSRDNTYALYTLTQHTHLKYIPLQVYFISRSHDHAPATHGAGPADARAPQRFIYNTHGSRPGGCMYTPPHAHPPRRVIKQKKSCGLLYINYFRRGSRAENRHSNVRSHIRLYAKIERTTKCSAAAVCCEKIK